MECRRTRHNSTEISQHARESLFVFEETASHRAEALLHVFTHGNGMKAVDSGDGDKLSNVKVVKDLVDQIGIGHKAFVTQCGTLKRKSCRLIVRQGVLCGEQCWRTGEESMWLRGTFGGPVSFDAVTNGEKLM